MSKENAIKGLNPTTATKPSISRAGLSNFATFHGRMTSTQDVPKNQSLNHFNNNNKYLRKYYLFKNINTSSFQTIITT